MPDAKTAIAPIMPAHPIASKATTMPKPIPTKDAKTENHTGKVSAKSKIMSSMLAPLCFTGVRAFLSYSYS